MWTINITTTATQFIKPPPYLFTGTAVSIFYLAPMIGVIAAKLWGYWFGDFLWKPYVRRHHGVCAPENRLWGAWPAAFLAVESLALFGETLQHKLS
jgi:hypothetical protein